MNPNTGIIYASIAIGVGLAVRMLKDDRFVFPPRWHVPSSARPILAQLLGAVGGFADMMVRGTPWKDALLQGLLAANAAMAGHALLVDGARGGKEVALPSLRASSLPPPPLPPQRALSKSEGELGSEELTPRNR